MKKFYLFTLVAIVAIFTACTYEITESTPTELEIKLKSEVTPASRVADANYQSTQIVEGQQVGVTITGAKNGHINGVWTAGADGSLTNTEEAVYYGNGTATITAYHPYNPIWASTSHQFSVSTDQSTNEGYLASDLLWATATSAKTESPVVLTFAHMLAKINVTLTSTDMTDLSDATISICGTNIATNFNSETGELSAATTANVQEIKAGVTTPNALTASAIVIPQTVEAGTKFIKVSHGGKTYYYTLTADKELKSGHSYSYNLSVKEAAKELKLKSENIIDWDDETNEGELTYYSNGSYAVKSDGSLVPTDEIPENLTDNEKENYIAVAIIDDEDRFMISKSIVYGSWGDWTQTICEKQYTNEGRSDEAGKENTDRILSDINLASSGIGHELVSLRESSVFKDWYIPSAGQWYWMIYNNKGAINYVLSRIGNTTIESANYWTSTEYDSRMAWYITNQGDMSYNYKDIKSYSVLFMRDF